MSWGGLGVLGSRAGWDVGDYSTRPTHDSDCPETGFFFSPFFGGGGVLSMMGKAREPAPLSFLLLVKQPRFNII